MSEEHSFAHFVRALAAFLLAGVALVSVFIAVVDPYRLTGLVDIAGFNRIKPGLEHYQEQIKLAGAQAVRPNVYLMGNSRMEIGFDPESRQFGAGQSAYNLAIPGTGVSVARRQFDALRAAGGVPGRLVLGVEFLDFLIDPAQPEPPRKQVSALAAMQWHVDTRFSVDAVLDSVQTLRIQRAADAQTMTARGFNPLHEYQRYIRDEGQFAIFRQRALENTRTIMNKPHGLVRAGSDGSEDWHEMHALADGAARQGASIDLVIYPYHAQILAMFERAGLWPVFEQWKAMLAREVARLRAQHPGAEIALWDFSGYGILQCERIPAKGERNQAKWYWEAGHFKAALGELMLARMLATPDADAVPPEFGFRLDMGTLEANRLRIEGERRFCAGAQPQVFADVAAMARALPGPPRKS